LLQLIVLRHGISTENRANRFTGWVDAPLAPDGEIEARLAAVRIRHANVIPQIAFTSDLVRATYTLDIVLAELGIAPITYQHRALNERHYGILQGRNKDEARAYFGTETVRRWRRSWNEGPPEGENLQTVAMRVLAYWSEMIAPFLLKNSPVLVVAHQNSLRALIMHIENITPETIEDREVPTGIPLLYELDENLAFISMKVL